MSGGFIPDRTPVPPRTGPEDPVELIQHIALMKDCLSCFPEGPRRPRSGYCSAHRDPVLLCNGWLEGWTMRGGMPENYPPKHEE